MRAFVAAAVLISIILPAQAQEQLPLTSRPEQRVRGINRSIQQEERLRRIEQQNRFEQNQIQQRLDRQQTFSNPSSPRFRNCPAGSIC
ncbi:hypothetical protein HB375_07410 [Microvirga sp. c23x22]|uniref:Uncharacterized protein n=2 Tax=Microvirga terricola TaxID=2719797 RepID=A0ABX0VBU4_9HYPH|nr:hypothetical protein [Microvirga terricola]